MRATVDQRDRITSINVSDGKALGITSINVGDEDEREENHATIDHV
jgi:hypothetical protein